jgi:hypothetical protein
MTDKDIIKSIKEENHFNYKNFDPIYTITVTFEDGSRLGLRVIAPKDWRIMIPKWELAEKTSAFRLLQMCKSLLDNLPHSAPEPEP